MLRIIYRDGHTEAIDVLGAALVVKPAAPVVEGWSHGQREETYPLDSDNIARIELDSTPPQEVPAAARWEEREYDGFSQARAAG